MFTSITRLMADLPSFLLDRPVLAATALIVSAATFAGAVIVTKKLG